MSISVDLSDLGKLQTLLGGASNKATTEMPRILDSVSESVAEQARRNAPILSGDLQSDIGIKKRSGTALSRTRWIGSHLKQGFFQEFGTSQHPPQPWLSPAANKGVETLGDEMEKLGAPW